MNPELLPHALSTDFQHSHDMSKAEALYFEEAWAHFHKIMTDVNSFWVQNTIWLNENFSELWNEKTPEELLNICLEQAVESLSNTSNAVDINKETKE